MPGSRFEELFPRIVCDSLEQDLSPAEADQWQQWTYEAGPLFGASPALADDARRRRMLERVEALNESMAELLFLTEVRTPLLDRVRELVTTRTWTPEEALGAVVQLYAAGCSRPAMRWYWVSWNCSSTQRSTP